MSETTFPEPVHKGFGKYEFNGKTYPNKALAQAARQALIDEQNDPQATVAPEGVDIKITDRSLVFRGSLLEVPMNEKYLPDGDRNPMYDREWTYAWAGYNGTDIADRQAKGYQLVEWETLQDLQENGKCPPHYLSLLRRDGKYLTYGDLVLMRIPRILYEQQQAAKHKRALEVYRKTKGTLRDEADNRGIPMVPDSKLEEVTGASDEVTIRL